MRACWRCCAGLANCAAVKAVPLLLYMTSTAHLMHQLGAALLGAARQQHLHSLLGTSAVTSAYRSSPVQTAVYLAAAL